MAANVTVIPPRAVRPDTLRVAAYCRVSSDSADQLHSYAAQIQYYTDLIQNHDGWDLVDVYADEGITGTRMDKREDFNRLLADCHKGKIDKVLVKSISRFARNTRDCLASLRELFRLGVSVLFEKENIDTGTLTTELMVSVSSSLAPAGVRLYLPKPTDELSEEDGAGRIHHLYGTVWISNAGWEEPCY